MNEEKKIIKCQSPEGCHDILPLDHVYHNLIKKVIRRRCRQAGVSRITPCVFENSDLFVRAMGESSDVARKELFLLEPKGEKKNIQYALRPELTAGIVRAYIEHGMASLPSPVRLYAFESVFRYDRPQKNRYRQFYQWSTEIIGERDPGLDAQMIHLAFQVLKDLKIEKNVVVLINTLGQEKERQKFKEALVNYFYGKERNLCPDCQERLLKNPLRILDCKQEDCQILAENAPKMDQFFSEDTKEYFAEVLELLDAVSVPYKITPSLVRGLDYYTDTVFEIVDTEEKGQQTSLIAGGRYDGLVEELGGISTPAFGFAMGVNRVENRLQDFGFRVPVKDKIHVYVAQLGALAKKQALKLLEELHNVGIYSMGAMGTPSLKAQLKNADKFDADYAVIMGQIEVQEGVVILRNMKEGSQETIPYSDCVKTLISYLGKKNLEPIDFPELDAMKISDEFEF
jgi:histidyl-tRNA synthetase